MTQCKRQKLVLSRLGRRRVEADFSGGRLSSNAGLLLVREIDRKLGLLDAVQEAIPDPRNPAAITHQQRELLSQRIFALAAGYEDGNDHQALRCDPALQLAAGREPHEDWPLASPATLCRLENRITRDSIARLHEVLVEQFLSSYDTPPPEVVLDLDATDDPTHGNQEGRFFHGYYGHYCYLPLYVFCGQHLLCAYLRPSNIDAAKHSRAITKLLVQRIRQRWPQVKIILRGDSGFCRWRLMRWCDRHGVFYVFGLARNARLESELKPTMEVAQALCEATGQKQRLFTEFLYAAKTWDRPRRVIGKAEYSSQGANPRFVVTNLTDPAAALYDDRYCPRGDMENRIKEQQLYLFADRTSCSKLLANQFRLLLSGLAYTLLDGLRRWGFAQAAEGQWQSATIRERIVKVAARVWVSARRIFFQLPTSSPVEPLFRRLVVALCDSG
jgi:Transposase DDE domain group 1